LVKVITNEEAAENDYNLSPSRYVDTSEKEVYRPIPEVLKELRGLEKEEKKIDADLKKVFVQMGFK
jgi:type I restriction enzyme M protein